MQREKVTVGLWNVVARKLAEFNFFFFPLEEKSSDRVLTVNSEASCAGSLLYSVNSNCIIFFFSIMLSLQNLLHGNHCYTLGISSNRRENVLASLSLAQKNMLAFVCI